MTYDENGNPIDERTPKPRVSRAINNAGPDAPVRYLVNGEVFESTGGTQSGIDAINAKYGMSLSGDDDPNIQQSKPSEPGKGFFGDAFDVGKEWFSIAPVQAALFAYGMYAYGGAGVESGMADNAAQVQFSPADAEAIGASSSVASGGAPANEVAGWARSNDMGSGGGLNLEGSGLGANAKGFAGTEAMGGAQGAVVPAGTEFGVGAMDVALGGGGAMVPAAAGFAPESMFASLAPAASSFLGSYAGSAAVPVAEVTPAVETVAGRPTAAEVPDSTTKMLADKTVGSDWSQGADTSMIGSTKPPASKGIIDSIIDWAEKNPKLAAAGVTLAGNAVAGAAAGAGNVMAAQRKADLELRNKEQLTQFYRDFLQGGSAGGGGVNLRVAPSGKPLMNSAGNPVYGPRGIINRAAA